MVLASLRLLMGASSRHDQFYFPSRDLRRCGEAALWLHCAPPLYRAVVGTCIFYRVKIQSSDSCHLLANIDQAWHTS